MVENQLSIFLIKFAYGSAANGRCVVMVPVCDIEAAEEVLAGTPR